VCLAQFAPTGKFAPSLLLLLLASHAQISSQPPKCNKVLTQRNENKGVELNIRNKKDPPFSGQQGGQ
jgi:hypothetical protein